MPRLSTPRPIKTKDYLLSNEFFFDRSKLLYAQNLELFDFFWPTATAIWNLRWQVKGYIDARGDDLTTEELFSRFASDEKIMRANLYRACIDTSWNEHLQQYAQTILIYLFAYYESWLKSILKIVDKSTNSIEKGLQFPSDFSTGKGIMPTLSSIQSSGNNIMENAFYEKYKRARKYKLPHIESMMICYRYFKELRNCIAHHGGEASNRYIDAQSKYKLLTKGQLSAKEKPRYKEVALGEDIYLDLRGVVGFSDIILKIVKTLDAEFIKCDKSINEFNRKYGMKVGKTQLPVGRENARIKKHLSNCNFKRPDDVTEIRSYLKSIGLI